MITRIGAAARRSHMSIGGFQTHWKEQHGPTAGAIPDLKRYVQHHAVVVDGRSILPYPGFDACSELDFESIDAMDEGFRLAAESGELKADEDRFVDKEKYSWLLGETEVRFERPGAPPNDPITLVTWWRSHPASNRDRLVEVLTGEWERSLDDGTAVTRRTLAVARDDLHQGRGAPTADVVEIITFGGLDVVQGFIGGHMQEHGPMFAGIAFGVERHVARVVVII